MIDAWTNIKGRGVMNLVVHNAQGVYFLDYIDYSYVRKDDKYIFDTANKRIVDVGRKNVVQIVTNTASVNTMAASLEETIHILEWVCCSLPRSHAT